MASGFNPGGVMDRTVVGWLEWPPVHVPHAQRLERRVIDGGQPLLRASMRLGFQVRPRADLVQPAQRETTENEFDRGHHGKRPGRSRPDRDRLASLPVSLSNLTRQKFGRTRSLP